MISTYDWLRKVRILQAEISSDAAMIWDALHENDAGLVSRLAGDMKLQAEGVAKIADYLERNAVHGFGAHLPEGRHGK